MNHVVIPRTHPKKYYDTHSREHCLEEIERIGLRYPDRVPVIVEQAEASHLPAIDKQKFLVPRDMSLGQFTYTIRRRMALAPELGMFIFINNSLPSHARLMGDLYTSYRDERGFLLLHYSGESVFGW